MMRLASLAVLVVFLGAQAARAENLSLVCAGTGTYPQPQSRTATVIDPATGQTATGTSMATNLASIDASARFELADNDARILMPPIMTPPLNNGSNGGWWELDRLEVTDAAIVGRFTLNLFNKPRVTIDRIRGTIEVDGNFNYYFLGECEVDDAPERRF